MTLQPPTPVPAEPVQLVVYWDIDGTLLTTSRAGVPALEDAAEAVLGRRPDLATMATAGLTDRMIARELVLASGRAADEQLERDLLDRYTAELPARLEQRRGRVLAGAREALEGLAARGNVLNVLLTGNVRAGAVAKLRSYDLLHFFDLELSGFAEDGHERVDIARAAMERVRAHHGDVAADGALIGDTPYDIEAGRLVGLRVVAVGAMAAHTTAELAALDPWWAVDSVPSADALCSRLAERPA